MKNYNFKTIQKKLYLSFPGMGPLQKGGHYAESTDKAATRKIRQKVDGGERVLTLPTQR
jgi:hypothetical protein